MMKHGKKTNYWIPNGISRYNGVIYAAILRHISDSSFRSRYSVFFDNLRSYINRTDGKIDRDSCLTEISAAGESLSIQARETSFDPAVLPLSKALGLDLSGLNDPEIIRRGRLFIRAIKEVPKRFMVAAILAGLLFAGGENWRDMADITIPILDPEMAAVISSETAHSGTPYTVKEAAAEEEKLFDPDLPKPLNGKIVPYIEPEHADKSRDGIIKALGMANDNLPETTKQLYAKHIINASKKFGLNPALIAGVVITESTGKSCSVSGSGARGLMQVMWSVHGESLRKKFGYKSAHELLNPEKGLMAGCWILKGYMERSGGNIKKALSSYLGSQRSGYYYNKIMKWAKIAQPQDQDFRFIKALADGGFTNREAEAVLKTTVMLDMKGPMDAEGLVNALIVFMPDAGMDRIAEMASLIIKHEKTEGGRVVSRDGNAEEAEYMLKKISPGFDRDVCGLEFEAAGYASSLGRLVSSVKSFPVVNAMAEKTNARDW